MIWPTLYKTTSTGKVQEWNISVSDNLIKIEFGQQNGKKQIKQDLIKFGKNIGRSNETSPAEQAQLEAKARWTKQVERRGYSSKLADTRQTTIRPMLAHKYKDHQDKVDFPCYIQPKLDGNRCLAFVENGKVKLVSRANKEFTELQHIKDELKGYEDIILDGEIFCKDIPINEINSLIKRKQPNTLKLQYHVYDYVDDTSFKSRHNFLSRNIKQTNVIIPVQTEIACSVYEIEDYYNKFVQMGYEGAIIRSSGGIYKGHRSTSLLKLKEFLDDDFKIVDVVENEKMPGTGVVVLTTGATTFRAMPEGSMEHRAAYWTNRNSLIGKTGIVRYFCMTQTEKPVPFHPVFVRVREEQEG